MWATQVTSHVSLHSCQAVHQFTGIDWAEILHGIDIVSTTQTSVKCSAAKYSWIDDSLVHEGWSSWCVRCARGGSRDLAKGTCLSRSQRLTCYGQMTAWPLTGLLPACPTCQHPRPSFQDMRSRTTHLGSICLLRSVFTSDFSSTLGCCLRLYQFSIHGGHCTGQNFKACAPSQLLPYASSLFLLCPPVSHSMLSFAYGISFLTHYPHHVNTAHSSTAAI
jgi:hypothetical protein